MRLGDRVNSVAKPGHRCRRAADRHARWLVERVARVLLALAVLTPGASRSEPMPMRVFHAPDGSPLAVFAGAISRSVFLLGVDTGSPVSQAFVTTGMKLSDDPALEFVSEPWMVDSPRFLGDSRERAVMRLWVGKRERTMEVAVMRTEHPRPGARVILGVEFLQNTIFRMDFGRSVLEMDADVSNIATPVWSAPLVLEKGRYLLETPRGGRRIVDTGFHVADLASFAPLQRLRTTRADALRAHPGPHGRVICAPDSDEDGVADESLRMFRHRVTCGFEIDPDNIPSLPVLGIRSAIEGRWSLTFTPTTDDTGERRVRMDIGR